MVNWLLGELPGNNAKYLPKQADWPWEVLEDHAIDSVIAALIEEGYQ